MVAPTFDPSRRAEKIVRSHIPEGAHVDRERLADEIRWAIVQGQVAARQPPELEGRLVPAIVFQIVTFVDEYLRQIPETSYPDAANRLRDCRCRLIAAKVPGEV